MALQHLNYLCRESLNSTLKHAILQCIVSMLNVMFSSLALRVNFLIISSHSVSSVSAVIKQSAIKVHTRNITTYLIIFPLLFHWLIKPQIIIINSTLFLGGIKQTQQKMPYLAVLANILESIINNPVYFSEWTEDCCLHMTTSWNINRYIILLNLENHLIYLQDLQK